MIGFGKCVCALALFAAGVAHGADPAFDFADHELIAGIVTEYGIARPPYTESLKEIFRKKAEAQAEGKRHS